MTKEEAIKYLQQLYPNGGHCWLDEKRIEAISMAINALQEEPAPKVFEDMLNAKTAAESLGISPEEYDKIVDECLYGKEPELVDEDDLPNKEEGPVKIDRQVSKMADEFAEREYETDGYERQWLSKGYYHGYMDAGKGKFEEPVSEELEKASKEWLTPQLDNSYAVYGETKMMELTYFDGYAMLDAIEFGAKWQFERAKEALLSEVLPCFMHGGEADEVVAKLEEVLNQKK